MTFPGTQTIVPDPSLQQGQVVIPPSEIVPAEQVAQQPVFTFNFSEAPWEMVLRQFAEQFEMPLQISFQVEGSLTYFDGRSYTIPQAIDIFNDYLLPKGAILISHGGKLTVVGANADGNLVTRGLYIGDSHDCFEQACEHLQACKGRIVVMGMGKSGHIGSKIAATLGIVVNQSKTAE